MCGITGIYHFKNSKTVKESDVVKMRDTLIHRGPDDAGAYVSPNNKVGLGTRRLKIIDLTEAGHMPMSTSRPNSKPNVWITYNGEVYNFKKLRAELDKKGYKFKSRTDTEVILNSYLEYGFDCVKKFNGMFAFTVWDEEKQLLFAARDHVGIKPFYYAIQNGTFYFGSEIKSILAHPDFKKELNEEGLSHYLTFGSAPAPYTLFEGIKKLPAAHYLLIRKRGEIEKKAYWSPVKRIRNQELGIRNENEYIKEVRELLRGSIREQMVSDVPFGCFLSGGVDSSTNAALMSEALGKPVEMFSVGYKDLQNKNEFQYSRKVAEFLGKKPHEVTLDESHMHEFLPQYARFADDPVSDPVCFPLFWLSKFTRDSGTIVIQVGEGADEIFAGYEQYIKAFKLYKNYWRWMEKFPSAARRLLGRMSKFINAPKSHWSEEYTERLARGQEPFWGLAIAFGDAQKNKLLTVGFKNTLAKSSYEIVRRYYKKLKEIDSKADFLKQMTYIDIKHRLPDFLLARADKMTMAHSVEGRVPFLDRRLVELVFNMPNHIKVKGNEPKYILKKAIQGIIPDEIINRKKQGFLSPIGEWLKSKNKIAKELTDVIFSSKLSERNLLNYDYVKKLIYAHQHQNIDQHFKVWTLITLSLWYDHWMS